MTERQDGHEGAPEVDPEETELREAMDRPPCPVASQSAGSHRTRALSETTRASSWAVGAVVLLVACSDGQDASPETTGVTSAPTTVEKTDVESICEGFLPIYMDYIGRQITIEATYGALRVMTDVYPESGLRGLASVADGAITTGDIYELVLDCETRSTVDYPSPERFP